MFGSALHDDFRPGESDLDLLIEFGPMQGYQKAIAYFDLLNGLQSLLGVDVDLVMKGALANPYLAREIEQSRQLLDAAPFCRLSLTRKPAKPDEAFPAKKCLAAPRAEGPKAWVQRG